LTHQFGDEFLLNIFTTDTENTEKFFLTLSNGAVSGQKKISVRSEMVDFGPVQGRSDFATAGVAVLRRGLQRARTPARAKKCRFWAGTI
jgi:hypothetical protein